MKFLCDFSLIKPDFRCKLKHYGCGSLLWSAFRRKIHIFEPSKMIFTETNERVLSKFRLNSIKSCRPTYTRQATNIASLEKQIEKDIFVKLAWTRPNNVPYPNIWEKFEVKSKDGQTYKFQLEDVTPDRYDEFLDFMYVNYDCRELMSRSINLISDPTSVAAIRSVRRKLLHQKASVIITLCDDKDNAKLVAATTLLVVTKNDPRIKVVGEKLTLMNHLVDTYMDYKIDPFQLVNSDRFFTEYGAAVAQEYSGLGLGIHLLTCYVRLGKVWNIPGAITYFTSSYSQRNGEKLGFKVCKEVSYEDFKDENGKTVFPIKDTVKHATTIASLEKQIEKDIIVNLAWTRPNNVPYPNIWEKFEVKSKDGQTYKLQIEDVTPDRYDEFLDFMYVNYDCRELLTRLVIC
ncbi:hypothetical protein V9T40_003287 [Parthenolecanium corni]|uniref:N-acetyltransferase domain-containing protein n=1 Tax=Parthenolecanium corni TaxID=536013 RepID=A0AAN9Y7V3_9HEMI